AIAAAEALFFDLEAVDPALAPYAVTGAHHRQVYASMSLWELYHLINLRTSPEAQWDIRMAMESLYEQVRAIHPSVIKYAKRRA
ncbi:FAD-dependent thymidylate synthase, partial [Calditerricola satsumensis]